jgi:hypothetical protein
VENQEEIVHTEAAVLTAAIKKCKAVDFSALGFLKAKRTLRADPEKPPHWY